MHTIMHAARHYYIACISGALLGDGLFVLCVSLSICVCFWCTSVLFVIDCISGNGHNWDGT